MAALEDILGNLTGNGSQKDTHKRVGGDAIVHPIDLGNGVVFFDCTGEQFGKSLSAFIKSQKAIVLAMTANTNHNGYFVVVR